MMFCVLYNSKYCQTLWCGTRGIMQADLLVMCPVTVIDTNILHVVYPTCQMYPLPWEIQKKSFSTVGPLFIHTSDYLRYLTRKQAVVHLPTPPENVTTLTGELQNFFIWLKVCCILKRASCGLSSVVLKRTRCDVATGMSGKQCHSKCSEWPRSALIHACSLFDTVQSRSTPRCAEIQPMSQQAAVAGLNMSISTRAPPVASPRRSTRVMQNNSK